MRTRLLLILALSMVCSLFGCKSEPQAEAPPKDNAAPTVVIEHPLRHLQHARLQRILNQQLPESLARRDGGNARRLCDLGRATIEQLKTPPEITEELQALIPVFQRRCTVDLAKSLLDDLLNELQDLDEEQRTLRCDQAGTPTVFFSLVNESDSPEVKKSRDRVLAVCPELAKRVKEIEEGQNKQRDRREQQKRLRRPKGSNPSPGHDGHDHRLGDGHDHGPKDTLKKDGSEEAPKGDPANKPEEAPKGDPAKDPGAAPKMDNPGEGPKVAPVKDAPTAP